MKQTNKLSEKQRSILDFIQLQLQQTNLPPTIREIGEACGIGSTSVVNYNLNKLATNGYIARVHDKSRGIRLTRQTLALHETPVTITDEHMLSIPLVGQIVAGSPAPHPGDDFGYYFDDEDLIGVPRALIHMNDTSKLYALKVNGLSMIDAMINDGDLVILNRQVTANSGDMVAALLSERNETTLKYWYPEGDQVRLQPANRTMEPIYVAKDAVEVQGRVLAVMRSLH